MDETIDVAGCLQRWKQGDEAAAEMLITYLYPVICRIVRRHLPRRDSEEDLIQEVLMKTFSRLHQYKADAPLSHWVSRLATTTCLDRLRAHKVRPELRWADLTPVEAEAFDTSWLEGATPHPAGALEARDLVAKVLETLPPEERSLILMVDLEGRSLEDISETTGWGLSKIKMRLFRVRAKLRKTMQQLGEHL